MSVRLGLVVIYTRFSSDLQRDESCTDQERKVREGLLSRYGVDPNKAHVIKDEAISGTREDRPGYEHLRRLILDDRVAVLAVDDQSRLSRGDNVKPFIKDLVFHHGRFISVGEDIDTARPGWEIKVGVMELHHSMSNGETGRRVRRGLEGRFLDGNGSAGSFPYGYRSTYADSNWQEMLMQGKKPRKVVVVHEGEAEVVRLIFRWYAIDKLSYNAIARKLNAESCSRGKNPKSSFWTAPVVRLVLRRSAYIGEWRWGVTETVRDSRGKKRFRQAQSNPMIQANRPSLRIVPQELWDLAEKRRSTARVRPVAAISHRGTEELLHPRHVSPKHAFSGLIRCAHCGFLLTTRHDPKGYTYLRCPSHGKQSCPVNAHVPLSLIQKAVFEFLTDLCSQWPDWIGTIENAMRTALEQEATETPSQINAWKSRHQEVRRQISNLADQIAREGDISRAISGKLRECEAEELELERLLRASSERKSEPISVPNETEIRKKLSELPTLLEHQVPAVADLLRRVFSRIEMVVVPGPGRKRGYAKLKVKMSGVELLATALGESWRAKMNWQTDLASLPDQSPEFLLPVTPPTRMELCAKKSVEMRAAGMYWRQIAEATGLSTSKAWESSKIFRTV